MAVQLSEFMVACPDAIVDEWQIVASPGLSRTDERDIAEWRGVLKAIVMSIAADLQRADGRPAEPARPSLAEAVSRRSAASRHGALRQRRGLGSAQLVREFGALRAAVLARWHRCGSQADGAAVLEQTLRFDQAVDNALRDSIDGFVAALTSARDAYLFTLGQDLRLPLTTLHAANTTLGQSDFPLETRQAASRRAQRALARMGALLSDLMEYTRNRGVNGIPVERSPADLRVLCEESIALARATHPGQRFETGFSGDLVTTVDGPRMQQALSNLLHNAVTYGDGATPIRLTALATRSSVTLSVWNAGPAIPGGSMRTIFEPRIRTPQSDPAAPGHDAASLGLGLFIVREIAVGHGGDVDAVSTAGGGTRFTIHLPRVSECGDAAAAPIQTATVAAASPSAHPATKHAIGA